MSLIPLLSLFVLMLLLKSPWLAPFSIPTAGTSIALGFILIFAFLAGKQSARLRLPGITGFLLAGLVCGPFVLGFLSPEDVHSLQLLDGLALSLIALTAGGEMRIERLRTRFRGIFLLVIFQTLFVLIGFVGLAWIARPLLFPVLGGTVPSLLAFALLTGTLATATSPSTTIAVITESRARGPLTDLVLSTAVVKDFFVIALFALMLSVSRSLLSPQAGAGSGFPVHVLWEIGGSVLTGAAVGVGIVLYLKYIRRELTVFILAVAFFTYQISHGSGLHPLMICLTAGFLVQNLSSQGDRLILALEKVSTPVYVVFFAISGASLDLDALRAGWVLALACVALRGALKFGGTWVGARLAGEKPAVRRAGWTGFISQAGVTLGMAVIVENSFPEWGARFKALILAVIAINQVAGPILLQKLLERSGETGQKPE
jgi:Kef-type K+ transport system membrane component KefB